MLLLPYRDKSIARSLPVVTIALMLACIVVMFGFQGQDPGREQRAYAYYQDSGLGTIELPRYQAYLAARNDPQSAERLHLLRSAAETGLPLVQFMQGDSRFLADLHARRVVRPEDPEFARWHEARARFDELLESTVKARYSLGRAQAADAWRFVTYGFLHGGVAHLLGNLLVLALVGPFVEAALGPWRFLLAYLAGGAAAGALHLLVSDASVIGASGAIAATVGMLAVLYGTRKVPVFYWIFIVFGTTRIPALALLPIWLLNEGYQWSLQSRSPLSGSAVAYGAHVGGLCAGVLLAWLLAPRSRARDSAAEPAAHADSRRAAPPGSALAVQAQEAASRLDIRRATRLYRQLVELEPTRTEYLGAYLNVALLGAEEEALRDAALRLLWNKFRTPTDDLRRTFLQLTQEKVLKALPVDEHLRLARRLVRFHEDAAALRVIDALLRDDHLRELYARQLADCLLGLFTAYTRHGLTKQADQINSRLSTYFPTGMPIGGIAPSHRPPSTILTSIRPTLGRLALDPAEAPVLPATPPTRPGKLRG
jgi:membrane associated rhomboid family serine protease